VSLIKKGHHACFDSSDLEATKLFYCGLLGLEVAHEFRNDANELYGVFIHVGGDTYMEFFRVDSMSDFRGRCRHYALEVHDIEATRNHLIEHRFNVGEIRRGRKDSVLQFFMSDLDGLQLEFQQHDEHSALTQWQAGKNG
jgi:glyoxylase I family protein